MIQSFFFVSLVFILASCSHGPSSEFKRVYETKLNALGPEIQACLDFKTEVLQKAVNVQETDKKSFVSDPQLAEKFLDQFDVKKISYYQEQELMSDALKMCSEDNMKYFVKAEKKRACCDVLFDGFNFIKSLAHGIKNPLWKRALKEKALEKIQTYLDFEILHHHSLVHYMITMGLLTELNELGFVDPKATPKLLELESRGHVVHQELIKKLKTEALSTAKHDCQTLEQFLGREKTMAAPLWKDLDEFWKQIVSEKQIRLSKK